MDNNKKIQTTAAMPKIPAATANPVSTALGARPAVLAGRPLVFPALPAAAAGAGLGPAAGAAATLGLFREAVASALGAAAGGLGAAGAVIEGVAFLGAAAAGGFAPPAGRDGSRMVAEEGLGGRLMRTVSFFGLGDAAP